MTRIGSVNLLDMTFLQVKQLAKTYSGLTSEKIAERTGFCPSHVSRHFKDPDYSFSVPHIPKLCDVLGNDLHVEWQCEKIGGHFFRVDASKPEDLSVDVQMAKVCKETADVMSAWSQSNLDGVRTADEARRIDAELAQLIRKATECRMANQKSWKVIKE